MPPWCPRTRAEYGKRRNNYGDLSWWDMLFGTYENPETWDGRCGFDDEKKQRLTAMLAFRDVHREG